MRRKDSTFGSAQPNDKSEKSVINPAEEGDGNCTHCGADDDLASNFGAISLNQQEEDPLTIGRACPGISFSYATPSHTLGSIGSRRRENGRLTEYTCPGTDESIRISMKGSARSRYTPYSRSRKPQVSLEGTISPSQKSGVAPPHLHTILQLDETGLYTLSGEVIGQERADDHLVRYSVTAFRSQFLQQETDYHEFYVTWSHANLVRVMAKEDGTIRKLRKETLVRGFPFDEKIQQAFGFGVFDALKKNFSKVNIWHGKPSTA